MKVALVHDFLTEYGGAERVLEALHEIYPNAPVFTAYYKLDNLGPAKEKFKNWKITTNWGQKLPFWSKLQSPYRIIGPLIFEGFDFKNYDLVISSTNTYFAKSIITGPQTLHICYCHTPPRYLYGYPTARDWKKYFWGRILGEVANFFLRMADFAAAQRVDCFIANSAEVRARIEKFYRRDAVAIYPPVDIKRFASKQSTDYGLQQKKAVDSRQSANSYYLCVSRLARAKRVDLAIEAASKLGLHLKIVGTGREKNALKRLAAECKMQNANCKIDFLGEVSDKGLISAYQNCRAVIFPAMEEDFGLVPVEAMAAGKPVIALRSGGVRESVVDGVNGIFFDQPTVESLILAIKRFEKMKINLKDCVNQAQKFDKVRFKAEIQEFVEGKLNNFKWNWQLKLPADAEFS